MNNSRNTSHIKALFVLALFAVCVWMSPAYARAQNGNGDASSDGAPTHNRPPGPGEMTGAHTLSGDPVYMVGGPVSPPRLVKSRDPKYTAAARNSKLQGTVVLSTIINTLGLAEQVKVIRSLDPGLDKNAAEALEHWQFTPATKDNQPVAVVIHVELNFKM